MEKEASQKTAAAPQAHEVRVDNYADYRVNVQGNAVKAHNEDGADILTVLSAIRVLALKKVRSIKMEY